MKSFRLETCDDEGQVYVVNMYATDLQEAIKKGHEYFWNVYQFQAFFPEELEILKNQ